MIEKIASMKILRTLMKIWTYQLSHSRANLTPATKIEFMMVKIELKNSCVKTFPAPKNVRNINEPGYWSF